MVVLLASIHGTVSSTSENDSLLLIGEKRNSPNDRLKDQTFKKIEALECTVTMSTIRSTSNLR